MWVCSQEGSRLHEKKSNKKHTTESSEQEGRQITYRTLVPEPGGLTVTLFLFFSRNRTEAHENRTSGAKSGALTGNGRRMTGGEIPIGRAPAAAAAAAGAAEGCRRLLRIQECAGGPCSRAHVAARRQVHHTPLHPRPADGGSSGAAPAPPGQPGGGRPVPETSWATDPLP